MLRVRCACGRGYQVDDRHQGRTLRCRCGRNTRIEPEPKGFRTASRHVFRAILNRLPQFTGRSRRRRSPRSEARRQRRGAALYAAACVYAGLCLLAAVVLWQFGDRALPGTALLFGPRWLLLLPLAALLPAALLLRRTALMPLAAAAVIALGPVLGLQVNAHRLLAPPAGEGMFRVASFNAVDSPLAALSLIDLLDKWKVAVAAIQECSTQLPALLELQPEWHLHSAHGLCLLSRYPIVEAEPARWAELDIGRRDGIGGSGTAVRYRVSTPSGMLNVINLHLETPRKGLERLRYGLEAAPVGENTRMRAIGSRRAFQWVGEARDSIIVLGDFNMPVESAIYRENWTAFQNAFSRAGQGFGATKRNGWIRVRIDHVLLGNAWRARRAWVGPDIGSDHWPLFAEITPR
jgi:vancomycin resistance protein VanJ